MVKHSGDEPTSDSSILSLLRRLVIAGCNVYVVGIVLYFALRLLTKNTLGIVQILNHFIIFGLVIAFPLLAVVVLIKAWRTSLLMIIPVAAFGVLFGELFLPQRVPDCDANCQTITVMTYNVANMASPPAERMTSAILDSEADIIVFQELSTSVAALLENDEIAEVYPHQALFPNDHLAGNGVISKYPIIDAHLLELETSIFPYVQAEVDIDGESLTVISMHPAPPGLSPYYSPGLGDLPTVVDLATSNGPAVIAGDLNATDQSRDVEVFHKAGMRDAWREAGAGVGFSFPAYRRWRGLAVPPLVRIDYVFYTQDFQAVEARHGIDAGSDHLPVIAELVWQR